MHFMGERQVRMMDASIVEAYAERVYGYAIKHTYSREEADDLSQEILFTVIKELPNLRDESRFDPWLWGIAHNVTRVFKRSMGKQRAMYCYDALEDVTYEQDFSDDADEKLYASLRAKIAMLSSLYRDIIILHYYDGLSTRQIADKLNVPEGTVTWRLSEARKKLKQECDEMEVSALRPIKMKLDITGSGNYDGKLIPFPDAYINDALSQNILYYCYDKACGAEELAKLCGVPAYYIEDRIANLLKREAVIEQTKGKYRTDFIIWSDKYGIYCEENAERIFLPITDRMVKALKDIAAKAKDIDFYKAGRPESDLFYLYGIMAFNYAKKYCTLTNLERKTKYDGYKWCYSGNMETGAHKRILIGTQHNANLGIGGHYTYTIYSGFNGVKKRKMMYDYEINACEDILKSGRSDNIDAVTLAIQHGFIVKKDDGELFVTVPAFTMEQKERFDAVADKYLAPLMDDYSRLVSEFVSGYKKLFPKHLSDDADRRCCGVFEAMYTFFTEHAQKSGEIEPPSENCYCDVLIQFR